jgi:hypothetical protein
MLSFPPDEPTKIVIQSLWKSISIEFQSFSTYENPYLDVQLIISLKSPSGKIIEIPGFWDGNSSWKARFAPNEEGRWLWKSHADPLDDGLHHRQGSFIAVKNDSENPFYRHGFISLHSNQRAFAHADGKPFFWLGDTAWSIPATADELEIKKYLEIRSLQGFNLVQMNSLPQHDSSQKAYRQPFHIENGSWNLDRPQVDYFQILDLYLEQCTDAGILPALVVLWFDYVPETNLWWELKKKAVFSAVQAARYARYLTARTNAFGTIYIISGDSDFETTQSMAVYDAAAQAVRENNPYKTPLTAHINGEINTPQPLNQREWLDFHMYQSGHAATSLQRASDCASHAFNLYPVRPVLNSEPMYDHRYYLEPGKKIPTRSLLRRIYWTSWFSGATAGLTYGAHGVWSWDRQPISPDWKTLLSLDSAGDAIRFKTFLEALPWWSFKPAPEIAITSGLLCAKNSEERLVLAYLCEPFTPILLSIQIEPTSSSWFNPANGVTAFATFLLDKDGLFIDPPTWNTDAVLILKLPEI